MLVSGVVLVTVAVGALAAAPAAAGPKSCENRTNDTIAKLLECVTLTGVREHQAAFQAIADANGGNRFSGLPGHDASVDYVVDRLEAAGYIPVVQGLRVTSVRNSRSIGAPAARSGPGHLRRRRGLRSDRSVRPG